MYRLFWLLLLLMVCGCSTRYGDGCSWVRPIWMQPEDQLTRPTLEQIIIHNEAWAEICR